MTVLDRLKLELNNKDYFQDSEYTVFLDENNLSSTDNYDKATMQRNLLLTVIDILEAISNDVDLMRSITDATTNLSVGEALKLLQTRISDIKDKIATISIDDDEEHSSFGMMFYKNR